jgi:hypothetical protein
MALLVTFKGEKVLVPLTEDVDNLQGLEQLLVRCVLGLKPCCFKIVMGGRQLLPHATPTMSLRDAGQQSGFDLAALRPRPVMFSCS